MRLDYRFLIPEDRVQCRENTVLCGYLSGLTTFVRRVKKRHFDLKTAPKNFHVYICALANAYEYKSLRCPVQSFVTVGVLAYLTWVVTEWASVL
jgi:hypothetical protein